MDLPGTVRSYARAALERLLAIPSVSAEGRGMDEAASVVRELLEELGFGVELHATEGAPVVFAERPAPEGRPTILFYNHYDVQPADPLDAWEVEPFALTEKDGIWYGRGSSDDKGQLVSRLAALRWFLERHGELPFGAKFVIEGEEEVGSPNLARYVQDHAARLAADGCVWEFGGVTASGRPMTYFGLKGILCIGMHARTAGYDLHSSLGAVVENPIYRLAAALASLRDRDGRVLVKGFYDDVAPLSDTEEELLAALPDEAPELAKLYGVERFLGGVTGAAFQRRLLTEPNVNYNGFHAGYGGPGSKTVLPAEAGAKLDLRLVPNQDPARILRALREHLDEHGFHDVTIEELETSEFAARSDADHPFVRATIEALREAYGEEPVVYPGVAGSGPMHPFVEHLGVPVVGLGCSYPGSRVHSPNEHIRVADFDRSVVALLGLLERYGAAS
ncbi:MAG: M20/M25/M40 family metallo-hydrolase [Trueperaceae bacterium]